MISPVTNARAARVPPQPGHAIPVHLRKTHPGEISLTMADTHPACRKHITPATTIKTDITMKNRLCLFLRRMVVSGMGGNFIVNMLIQKTPLCRQWYESHDPSIQVGAEPEVSEVSL